MYNSGDDWSLVGSDDRYGKGNEWGAAGSDGTASVGGDDEWTKSQRIRSTDRQYSPGRGGERRGGMKKSKDNTRVFVQNLPPSYKWGDLKDLFKANLPSELRTTVAFASVSMTSDGESKGCGIVQMETLEGVEEVIRLGKDGQFSVVEGGEKYDIYVRMDIKERNIRSTEKPDPNRAVGKSVTGGKKGYYSCANLDLETRDMAVVEEVSELVESRAAARGRRNFDASDRMRKVLLDDYSVRVDDRTMLWWFDESGGRVPDMVADGKSDGAWKSKDWSCTYEGGYEGVDGAEIEKLLKSRDQLRVNRDYAEADEVLDKVYGMGGEEGKVVVDDKKKLWKIVSVGLEEWEGKGEGKGEEGEREGGEMDAKEKCLALVYKFAPDKVDEVAALLVKFKGKEDVVFERLKERYMK
ncbi:hypothetical protein TL16_g04247 [Triparma laevis f. inornata]|uniref:RRM domain-containing protein n=1 Tax=Triparma laevis f. inornata TaxID=1714386 RepID=A0A9W7E4A5_9STRA|nr:hypothetical protein TL16_g04247 [Triparma laevis f. inornata]